MRCALPAIVGALAIAAAGCGGATDTIEYRGEKIKLTRAYTDFDEYKNDPNNIDPSETDRVQRLVTTAPIQHTFTSRLEAARAVTNIAFPGYGSGGMAAQPLGDGTRLTGFSVEIPRAEKERYFVFVERNGACTLIDDFVYPDTPGLVQSIVRRGDELVFRLTDGKEAFTRPYPSQP